MSGHCAVWCAAMTLTVRRKGFSCKRQNGGQMATAWRTKTGRHTKKIGDKCRNIWPFRAKPLPLHTLAVRCPPAVFPTNFNAMTINRQHVACAIQITGAVTFNPAKERRAVAVEVCLRGDSRSFLLHTHGRAVTAPPDEAPLQRTDAWHTPHRTRV